MDIQLRRISFNFKGPLNKPWQGYINPYLKKSRECQQCNGRGSTVALRRLSVLVSLLMLSGEDVERGQCHDYFRRMPLGETQGVVCGEDMLLPNERTGAGSR